MPIASSQADILAGYGALTDESPPPSVGQRPRTIDPLITRSSRIRRSSPTRDLICSCFALWQIETGHVVAVVQIVPGPQYWTMFLLPHGDCWRIDDMWNTGEREIGDNVSGPVYGTPVTEQ